MQNGKPIPFRQLLAIVREVVTANPSGLTAEWVEDSKRRLVALRGFAYPRPHEWTEAIRVVEAALSKHWGPRPAVDPSTRAPAPRPAITSPWRIPRRPGAAGWTSIGDLTATLPQGAPRDDERNADRDVSGDRDPATQGVNASIQTRGSRDRHE